MRSTLLGDGVPGQPIHGIEDERERADPDLDHVLPPVLHNRTRAPAATVGFDEAVFQNDESCLASTSCECSINGTMLTWMVRLGFAPASATGTSTM